MSEMYKHFSFDKNMSDEDIMETMTKYFDFNDDEYVEGYSILTKFENGEPIFKYIG